VVVDCSDEVSQSGFVREAKRVNGRRMRANEVQMKLRRKEAPGFSSRAGHWLPHLLVLMVLAAVGCNEGPGITILTPLQGSFEFAPSMLVAGVVNEIAPGSGPERRRIAASLSCHSRNYRA
jgi:hypothetical protein